MRTPHRARRPLVALVALVVALLVGYLVQAARSGDGSPAPTHGARITTGAPGSAPTSPAESAAVALSSLPPQAARTVALIRAGGPFAYPRNDGVVFHNYEHALPPEPDGYYHEYTVPTPGSSDRGARRIVTGRDGRLWYSGDHYESFRLVLVGR